jgi:site-specific DNA-cytosine methylase
VAWTTHPRPETAPRTVREALDGLDVAPALKASADIKRFAIYKRWLRLRRGEHDEERFSLARIDPDKPMRTIVKKGGSGGTPAQIHWDEPRYMTAPELRRLTTFPDDFRLPVNLRVATFVVGNAVPPRLALAVASNLSRIPEMKTKTRNPTVISLFAGCGGSSLGYKMAGYRELLAVEWDANAAATFRLNFPDVPVYEGDVAKLTVAECLRLAKVRPRELDVLDGSPPCQGFSTAGKRFLEDPRNGLFREYCRLLAGLQPKAFVMENVTGLIKGHMKKVYLEIMASLRACGYEARGEVLNAMHYGVPQSRERVIVVGVRKDLWRPEYGGAR